MKNFLLKYFLILCLSLPAIKMSAAPQLLQPPDATTIENTGEARFTFSEPMNTEGIDVEWSGSGIDPQQIQCAWVTEMFGFPIPPVTLACTYEGGWPGGVQVSYTLNPGDSGVIKSQSGEPLPETSGSFMTPGSGSGPCNGTNDLSSAVISLTKTFNYVQDSAAESRFDMERKAVMQGSVIGSTNAQAVGVSAATLVKPDNSTVELVEFTFQQPQSTTQSFPSIPDYFVLSETPAPEITIPTYDSEESLNADYPNGAYQMELELEGGGTETVSLPLDPSPEPPQPQCQNYAALQDFDVTQPLTIQWNAFTDAAQQDSINLVITEKDGPLVFQAPNPCEEIDLPVTDTSITIPANTFEDGVTYEAELSFGKLTHFAENNVGEFKELATFVRNTRFNLGEPDGGSGTSLMEFEGISVAEDGTVTLTISGQLANESVIANVQSTADFNQWSEVGSFVKSELEAAGGTIEVEDASASTQSESYQYYRVKVE